MTLPVGARSKKGCQRREASDNKPLLPKIPDDVTLSLIATKLSWGDCHRLSSVSHAWRHAIRSRQVHDSRILSQSTETLILLTYKPSKVSLASVVYSMRENRCYKLPPFPCPVARKPKIRPTFQFVAVDGRIYVLGGEFEPPGPYEVPGTSGVYVLDLAAGARQWKQCKSMRKPRARFGCGVLGGKIYVLGGLSSGSVVCDSEVYDPKEDTWSPITSMRCVRFDHQVATLGAELVVHGGYIVEPTDRVWKRWIETQREIYPSLPYDTDPVSPEYKSLKDAVRNLVVLSLYNRAKAATSLEVYNVIKDEWSVVVGPRGLTDESVYSKPKSEIFFMANGKYHVMNHGGIHVHDTELNSWTRLHSSQPLWSYTSAHYSLLHRESQMIFARNVIVVDDKLLTIVETVDNEHRREMFGKDFDRRINQVDRMINQACLFQGRGFGRDNEMITWERTSFKILFKERDIEFTNYFMHPAQF